VLELIPGRVFTAAEVSDGLQVGVSTLANWRTAGEGPVFTKAGKQVLYRAEALSEWLQSNERQQTDGSLQARQNLALPVPTQRSRSQRVDRAAVNGGKPKGGAGNRNRSAHTGKGWPGAPPGSLLHDSH